ncbi:MAG TPA: hypothetical protein VHI52_09775 [Verrucomicrobiae bacterium]|nr:hypothetical protein [Verrucomicrobiae bacterium]
MINAGLMHDGEGKVKKMFARPTLAQGKSSGNRTPISGDFCHAELHSTTMPQVWNQCK